jgi:hypothetical protein
MNRSKESKESPAVITRKESTSKIEPPSKIKKEGNNSTSITHHAEEQEGTNPLGIFFKNFQL